MSAQNSSLDRVLLCFPHGGLNDTLCQIEKCWQYAEQFNRLLVIDAQRSGLLGHFSDFFRPRPEYPRVLSRLSLQDLTALDQLDCRPAAAKGKLGTFKILYSKESRQFCEQESGTPLTFDFDRDHPEPLLVHAQCGGGTLSTKLLHRVTLSRQAQTHITKKLATLPDRYIGIHVRNTDYETDYVRLFESVFERATGQSVLVCSDDADVIAHAKAFFSRSTVVTVSEIPQKDRRPLHRRGTWKGERERQFATIAALTDLLALGGADELFFANVTAGHPSGFSLLAHYLAKNRRLIGELLSAPAD